MLILISPKHKEATIDQLRLPRKPLYDNAYEYQAIEGAGVELKRRFDTKAALRHESELQTTMAGFRDPGWARRLLEQEKGAKPWMFAQYLDPAVAMYFDIEHYDSGTDALLMFAQTSTRFDDLLRDMFHLQTLDRPGSDLTAKYRAENVTQHSQLHIDQETRREWQQ